MKQGLLAEPLGIEAGRSRYRLTTPARRIGGKKLRRSTPVRVALRTIPSGNRSNQLALGPVGHQTAGAGNHQRVHTCQTRTRP